MAFAPFARLFNSVLMTVAIVAGASHLTIVPIYLLLEARSKHFTCSHRAQAKLFSSAAWLTSQGQQVSPRSRPSRKHGGESRPDIITHRVECPRADQDLIALLQPGG